MANKGHSPKIQTVLLYAGVLVNLCMIIWLGGFTFRHHGADELTRASGSVVEAGKAQIAQHERWLKRLEHQLEQKVQNSAAVDVVGPARTINPPPAGSIHVVFSIECRINHHWQAEALFYSFHQLNHAGYITCLYSCNSPGDMNKTRSCYHLLHKCMHECMRKCMFACILKCMHAWVHSIKCINAWHVECDVCAGSRCDSRAPSSTGRHYITRTGVLR